VWFSVLVRWVDDGDVIHVGQSRPYAMAAMSHTMAIKRNAAPTGSRSNMLATAIFGTHGKCRGLSTIFVGEFFDAGFEFADSAVGLIESVVECDDGGCCWRHGTSSLRACFQRAAVRSAM